MTPTGCGGCSVADLQPCGTEAAYRRHKRHKEPADAACMAAHRQYVHEGRMARERKVR